MALIKCPECGNVVSEFAKQCPVCGCPIQPINSASHRQQQSSYRRQQPSRQRNDGMSTWLYVVIMLLAGAIIGVSTALFINYKKQQDAEHQAFVNIERKEAMAKAENERKAARAEAEREEAAAKKKSEEERQIINFITYMYNDRKYEDYDFLERHCTVKLLNKLRRDYYYDCDDGRCYAVWAFRSGAQDCKDGACEYRITSVHHVSGNTYDYSYYDMGWRGTNRIKVFISHGNEIIDDVKQL